MPLQRVRPGLYRVLDPRHPHLAKLMGEPSLHDRDFHRWWAGQDVLHRTHDTQGYHRGRRPLSSSVCEARARLRPSTVVPPG